MEFMPLRCRCDKKGSVPFAQMWRIELAEEVDDHNITGGKTDYSCKKPVLWMRSITQSAFMAFLTTPSFVKCWRKGSINHPSSDLLKYSYIYIHTYSSMILGKLILEPKTSKLQNHWIGGFPSLIMLRPPFALKLSFGTRWIGRQAGWSICWVKLWNWLELVGSCWRLR